MSQKDAIEQEIYDRLLMYFDGNTAKIHDAALDIAEYIGRIGERPKKEILLVPPEYRELFCMLDLLYFETRK